MKYRIHLQNFDGPLDLLLFLIRKNEVDIYDIPMAEITQQFMEYLEAIEMLDLDHASDFILMAATLIRIKVKMLLPKPEVEDDEEAEDPRHELVQRLLEYQRFKESAAELGDLEIEQRNFFKLANYEFLDDEQPEEVEPLGKSDVNLYDLMSVFVEVLKRVSPVVEHIVERIPVTIEDQAKIILSFLETQNRVLFKDILLKHVKEKIILIVTFIAILELVKGKQVALTQNRPFSEIWISKEQ